MPISQSILWFEEIEKVDNLLVGSKGVQLGELAAAGFPLADGFIITSSAYFRFLRENNLTLKINHLIGTIDFTRQDSIMQVSGHIKKLIRQEPLSDDLLQEIFRSYRRLSSTITDLSVAVSPSEIGKKPSEKASSAEEVVAGAQGETDLVLQVKAVWASQFDPGMIIARHKQNQDHFRAGIAVLVQQAITPEVSGKATSIDPLTNDKNSIIIEALFGLPDDSMQATPDHYEVNKADLKIVQKVIANQGRMMTESKGTLQMVKRKPTEVKKQKLSDNQILDVGVLTKQLERHFYFPQEITWVLTGRRLLLTQVKPLTPLLTKQREPQGHIPPSRSLLLQGTPASPGIAIGLITSITSASDVAKVRRGDILVLKNSNATLIPVMKKAAAIITETGGTSSHAALFAKSQGIPAIVGAENALLKLSDNAVVTVNGSKGEVYKGDFPHSPISLLPTTMRKTATKVYINLHNVDKVEKTALQHADGVGLLQAHTLLAKLGMHPKELSKTRNQKLFIDELSTLLERTCLAFYQRPVIYQAVDVTSTELRILKGGKDYEPSEKNPFIGFRGALRSIHDPKLFSLELEAIKKVRTEKKLKNLSVMLPFVRTVSELIMMKKMLVSFGFHRSPTFQLWLKVQTPANCISLDSFISAGIDGVMIDLDDLTMLTLGIDKYNSEVSHAFDEQNPAVLWAIERIIKTAHTHHIPSSLIGQSLLYQPELIEQLVRWGISSMTVSARGVQTARTIIADTEGKLVR
jgi:pyruvate,water dikinase